LAKIRDRTPLCVARLNWSQPPRTTKHRHWLLSQYGDDNQTSRVVRDDIRSPICSIIHCFHQQRSSIELCTHKYVYRVSPEDVKDTGVYLGESSGSSPHAILMREMFTRPTDNSQPLLVHCVNCSDWLRSGVCGDCVLLLI